MSQTTAMFLLLTACLAAENARLDFALALLAESRGDPAAAETLLEKARIADPTAMPLVSRAVDARMSAGDRAGAVKLYRDLAASRQDDLAVQFVYADFLQQNAGGDSLALKLATDTLEAALAKHPADPRIIGRLFRVYQTGGDAARAMELLDRLSQDDPDSALLHASLLRGISNAADAASREKLDRQWLSAVRAHPDDPSVARAASEHFRETERLPTAIDLLERHADANPSSLDLRTRLGILYLAAKREEEGEKTLKEVLGVNPGQWLAHQTLAKFYRQSGNAGLARAHGGELLKIRGGSAKDFLALADEWLAANEPREARLLLEKAAFDHPENPRLAVKLAIATRRDPQTRADAARWFRQAESLFPPDFPVEPEFLIESAEALIDQGQSAPAEERLRRAIRAYPPEAKKETAAALRLLAALWESEKRNRDAARALIQRAEALDR